MQTARLHLLLLVVLGSSAAICAYDSTYNPYLRTRSERGTFKNPLLVGGKYGYAVGAVNFSIWTDGTSFFPGEYLAFKFSKAHIVARFPDKQAFIDCNFTNAVTLSNPNSVNTGDYVRVRVTKTPQYYGCSVGNGFHCKVDGHKVRVYARKALAPYPPTVRLPKKTYALPWVGGGLSYSAWTKQHKLKVGDKVNFLFVPGSHNVWEFPDEEHFTACNFTDATLLTGAGNGTGYPVTVTKAPRYYGCSFIPHCSFVGMKIKIAAS